MTTFPFKKTVFVQVPSSPYHTDRVASRDSFSAGTTAKENEPWRVSAMQQPPFASSSLKRKLSYSEVPTQAPMAFLKKPKLASGAVTPLGSEVPTNSYIYCHQCGKKRVKDEAAHCTYVDLQTGSKTRRRCHNKYCKSCLKNRYSEDIDVIKTNPPNNPTSEFDEVTYDYKCPKCRDACNCSRCRKAKGLDPTGKFANTTRAPAESSTSTAEGTVKAEEAKAKRAPRQKPKLNGPLPTLKWTKIRTNLSVQDAEARFHIREFVLRFFSKALPKAHLEELEHISGNGRSRYEEDEIVPWIGEACLKSVILAFLSVLVEEETNETIKKAIQMGSKEMRSAGLGLSKIWQILSSLRDSLDASESDSSDGHGSDDSETVPSFPDPLPLPDSAANSSRRTRSARNVESLIVDTVQMIPVLLGLIDAVLETKPIRDELDKGAKESKDLTRVVKDSVRNANDRYEKGKKDTENAKEHEFKARRDAHKQILQDIEGAAKVAMQRFNPRFSPLGADREGRSYYGLSPSLTESDAAMEFISSMAAETADASHASKTKRKRRLKREENSLKEWSWFIAVRGKKPPPEPGTLPFKAVATADGADGGDGSDDDETMDKWWAIGSGAEIRKLITWITLKYRLNEGTISASSSTASTPSSGSASPPAGWDKRGMEVSPRPSKLELLALVANLEDYAMGLEFRVRDGDTANAGLVESDKGKGKST